MRITRLTGLRAGDLRPLEGELGRGLVALVGPPETASEVRRALVWSAVVSEGGVAVVGTSERTGVEALWGGTGGVADALAAAAGWVARAEIARVDAARAAFAPSPSAATASGSTEPEHANGRPLVDAIAELHARERELRELRAEWAEVTGDVEQATMDWLRERQDAETQLQAYRDRARELKARLAQIEAAGPDAPCPTCGHPLADHLKDVRVQLKEEYESVVQDGSWWRRRREQLDGKPEHLRELEGRGVRVHASVESQAERVERVRGSVRELEAPSAARAAPQSGSPEARALERLADELRARARGRVLRDAGRLAESITAGRVVWIRDANGEPVAEGIFHGGVPGARDRAAVELATRMAAAGLARAAGAPLLGMVVGEAFEALDPEDRLRAVDALESLAAELGQVLVVTGTDVVSLRPEAFARALELAAAELGEPTLRPLPVGVTLVRLSA